MAVTREEMFRLGKKILAKLDSLGRISVVVRPPSVSVTLQPLLTELQSILTELQTQSTTLSLDSSLTDIFGRVDGLEVLQASTRDTINTTLIDIDASLDAIEADGDASRIDLAAIEVLLTTIRDNADGVESLLGDIEANTDPTSQLVLDIASILTNTALLATINTRLSTGGTNISEQANLISNRNWLFVANATVTSVAGGANVEWTITILDRTDILSIRVIEDSGGSAGVIVTVDCNTTIGNHIVWDAIGRGISAGTPSDAPENTTNQAIVHTSPQSGPAGTEIRVAFSNVVVNDVLRVAIVGLARSSTAPVVDTNNTTATANFVTVLNQVDADP